MMNTKNNLDTDTHSVLELQEVLTENKNLILYNDSYNTFDFVIESLIKVCKHDVLQAEQCTYLVHYKGKCAVKVGTPEALEPYCIALLQRGLTAEIE